MNRKLTFLLQAILPTLTLVVGIFIGLNYHDAIGSLESYLLTSKGSPVSSAGESANSMLKNIIGEEEVKTPVNELLPTKEQINFKELWDVWEVLREKYYAENKISADDVLYSTISGMVDSLEDEYTVFFNPDDSDDFAIEVNGEMEGIGAEMIFRKKSLVILSVIKNSPAFKAGLKTDDIILKVDEANVSDLDFRESIKRIRGKKGTEVKLSIFRADHEDAFEVKIIRDKIDIENVTWEKVGKFAHLSVNRFTQDVEGEFNNVANQILASDSKGIILDLRDNGGGYMDQAVYIASAFIPEGVIVSRKYKDSTEDFFSASKKATLKDYPLVVLINGESASASEIVAGALQDYGLAKLVGEKSYGKGSVQQTYDFGKATLKFTVAKWFTPKQRNIDKIGIMPDIEVKITDEDIKNKNDAQLKRAIEYLDTVLAEQF